jgi:hypothetical protein
MESRGKAPRVGAELRQAAQQAEMATSWAREARDDVEWAARYAEEGRPDLAASMLTVADATVSRMIGEAGAAAHAVSEVARRRAA